MINNAQIIRNMTEDQKIALVADFNAAAGEAYTALGLPKTESATADDINRVYGGATAYPDLSRLAESWNVKLAENVVTDLLKRNGTEKFSLVRTPSVAVKLNPYSSGLSEDPYLNSKFAGAFATAIENCGGAACVGGLGLNNIDVEYLDRAPNAALLSNVVARPFFSVVNNRAPSALSISYSRVKGEYKDVNTAVAARMLNMNALKYAIAENVYEEAMRSGLSQSKLLFAGASASAIRAALKNYSRMKEDVERGSVTLGELEKAVAAGTAISDEMLYMAVDKVIDFIGAIVRVRDVYGNSAADGDGEGENAPAPRPEDRGKQFSLLASQESTVLLKNDGALPVTNAVKVATFGQIAREYADFDGAVARLCNQRGCSYSGHADGYALDADRSDELLENVAALASSADVVVAFVGLGARREARLAETKSVKLPANQRALIAELEKSGKTLIVAAAGGVLPDVSTCGAPNALLYAPLGGCRGAEALFNIIFGVVSPSGKLAFTAYANTDETFARQKSEIAAGRYKIGEFVGYRRYATEGTNVGYPFGHGLSYADFAYSNLKINDGSVEVTVRNNSARAGFEVAQMYVGKRDSAIVRPLRELKGFAKVMIAPNAAVQITFPINAAMLETFDVADGTRKTEGGVYDVYIGSSSTDIRLKGEITIAGATLQSRGDMLSDYLPAISNIASGEYKLNTVAKSAPENGGGFKSARAGESFSYERLFEDEFGTDEDEEVYSDGDGDDDISVYLDDDVTIKTIADGLISFASSKGCKIDADSARELIGAMTATRAVLLDCDENTFERVAEVVCGYFGCPVFKDDISDCEDGDALFRGGAEVGVVAAAKYAAGRREAATFVALYGVVPSRLGTVFAPFIRYSTAPDSTVVTFGAARRTLDVPPNMWFLMRLADGRKQFPAYVADMASVISPKAETVRATEDSDAVAPNYYQFIAAAESAEREYEIDEALWKKADKLENYVAARAQFAIGNKLCVQMEKIIASAMACGAEPTDALDCAVAVKLIPLCVSVLDGVLTADDDDFAVTVDNIFGEDVMPRCKSAVKRTKA